MDRRPLMSPSMYRSMGTTTRQRMRCDIDHQYRNNLWRLFPRVNCGCGYRKLYDCLHENFDDVEPNARIPFYLHEYKWVAMDVECEVSATTICDALAQKNGVPEDPKWSIVEYYRDKNLRRVLEDNEDVLRAHEELIDFSHDNGRMFFEYIKNKELTFGLEKILERPYIWFKEQTEGSCYFSRENKFCFVVQGDYSITFVTDCWYKIPNKNIWNKSYLLLQSGKVKLVNREIAFKIISKNKPHPLDIESQTFNIEGNEAAARPHVKTASSFPYQWIYKSSSSPMESWPLIKIPNGLDAKELKVYTHIEEPRDIESPTNHTIILIEKIVEKQVTPVQTPQNEIEDINFREESKAVASTSTGRRNKLSWSATIRARLVGRKKEKEDCVGLSSNSSNHSSSDEDVGCNGAKPKKDSKKKKGSKVTKPDRDYYEDDLEQNKYVGAEESLYTEELTDKMGCKHKIVNVAFDYSEVKTMWMEILRFTKNGINLRNNSSTFYTKQKNMVFREAQKNFTKRHNYFVNMDFTGAEGRIIEENNPVPSTSRTVPRRIIHDQEWFDNFTREPFEIYERQLLPCRRQHALPKTNEDIQKIIQEEEAYVEIQAQPRSILKKTKSNGEKKMVGFEGASKRFY